MSRILALALVGCTQVGGLTETGNPNVDAQMALQARTSRPADVSVDGAEAGVRVVEALVGLADVAVLGAASCGGSSAEWPVAVPNQVELCHGLAGLEFPLRGGGHCGARLEIVDGGYGAVRVSGFRGDGVPFELVSYATPNLEASAATAFRLDADADSVVLAFDAAEWFVGGALDDAAVDDGLVRVEPGHNDDVLVGFEEGFEASLGLFHDANDDGALSSDEAARPFATSSP